jgi:hypothetical protein
VAKIETRIFSRVTPEFYDKFCGWAAKLGFTKSQFGSLCIQAGMNAIIRAISPEESVTPETMAKIVEALQKQEPGAWEQKYNEEISRGL